MIFMCSLANPASLPPPPFPAWHTLPRWDVRMYVCRGLDKKQGQGQEGEPKQSNKHMNCQPMNCVHCCYPAAPLLSTHPSLFLPPLPSKPSDAAPAIISCCSCCRLLAEVCVCVCVEPPGAQGEEGRGGRKKGFVSCQLEYYSLRATP